MGGRRGKGKAGATEGKMERLAPHKAEGKGTSTIFEVHSHLTTTPRARTTRVDFPVGLHPPTSAICIHIYIIYISGSSLSAASPCFVAAAQQACFGLLARGLAGCLLACFSSAFNTLRSHLGSVLDSLRQQGQLLDVFGAIWV